MNEVILAIIDLLRTNLENSYKKYYYGEIRVPNKSYMPFIEVMPVGTRAGNKGTGGMMSNEYQIRVNIKHSLKSFLKENTNVEVLDHVQDLVERMEKRTDGNLNNDTVLGVLHDNLKLSDTANIVGDWEITYDEIDLGESYITYGSVLFTVRDISY